MPRLRFPNLKLGGTSWVVHGSFADNMRELSRDVDSMQFVLFDNKFGSNIPSKEEIRELSRLQDDLGMGCTVHFPHDICLSPDEVERVRCEDSCLRIMELFDELDPFAYILHLDGEQYGRYPSADMERWTEMSGKSLSRLAANARDGGKICAETLDYDIRLAYPVVKENGLSICIDVGHLVRYKHPVLEQAEMYLRDAPVLHIHGVTPEGADHRSMEFFDAALFGELMKKLTSDERERVMTIEVFEDDYGKSLDAIKKLRGNKNA